MLGPRQSGLASALMGMSSHVACLAAVDGIEGNVLLSEIFSSVAARQRAELAVSGVPEVEPVKTPRK